ncbi:MAG: hypothetical protein J0H23_12150 [Micrococcales bacterium]|nr:hypothetical protein [Micrococcales bacterium]
MSTTPGLNSRFRPPRTCFACGVNQAAWTWPRVEYCYDCMPGGPFTPPPCERCGSSAYFSQGRCELCHPGSPRYPGVCKDCLAWGVYRKHNWLCWACRWWRQHNPVGDCAYCDRRVTIGVQGACRLCLESARRVTEPGTAPDPADGIRYGLQLFFANMPAPRKPKPPKRPTRASRIVLDAAAVEASRWEQPELFHIDPDPELLRQATTAGARDWTDLTDGIVFEHAERFGWSNRQTNQVRRSLKMIQLIRPAGSTQIRASEVLRLRRYDSNTNRVSTLDVLEAAGLLVDDRVPTIERYFAARTAGLPPAMVEQLAVWFEVMRHGSTIPPRRKPRDDETTRTLILGIAPILHAWADAGLDSLAQVTSRMIDDALPDALSQRHWADRGLRSVFVILKARKLVFADPIRTLPGVNTRSTIPLPLEPAAVRAALNHPDPATALGVALVAFHGLTNGQARSLQLTDIADGRLTLPDGRVIPLAGPVRVRLAAWLDHRAEKWPRTLNTHLFITQQTAPRLSAPGATFPWSKAGLNPRSLRADRILAEIHATGGDVRRICDLFGIGIEAAMRYATTLGHPTFREEIPAPRPRALDT